MSLSRNSKILVAALAVATLAGTIGDAFAAKSRYTRRDGYARGHHRGYGAGPAIAGAAALGIIGAGIAANQYYNGYPSYSYGPDYGGYYGYDYHPNRGYYGPY